MLRTSLTLLLLLAPEALARAPQAERGSLEDLLRRARVESTKVAAALTGEVQMILGELEVLPLRTRAQGAEKLRRKLVELGPGVAPLLLPALEPGPADPATGEVDAEARFRAAQVAQVLQELRSRTITDALIELARTGTETGRVHALAVLGASPEPRRVAPIIHAVFESETGAVRLAALSALAELGGPEASARLAAALAHEEPEVVETALLAVAQARNREVEPHVLALLGSKRAPFNVRPVLEYYRALPELLEREHLLALAELAANPDVNRGDTVRILDMLRELEVGLDRNTKRALEPLETSANNLVAEAALALLARAGDKRARRLYLASYEEDVQRQEDYPEPYVARGHALYRIGDLTSASRDYRTAIKLENAGNRDHEPYVGLAKCYAAQKRYKDASDYLERSPLSTTRLRELAKEPVFADMLVTRYSTAFHLRDE
jgi:HEAT repeat protein